MVNKRTEIEESTPEDLFEFKSHNLDVLINLWMLLSFLRCERHSKTQRYVYVSQFWFTWVGETQEPAPTLIEF